MTVFTAPTTGTTMSEIYGTDVIFIDARDWAHADLDCGDIDGEVLAFASYEGPRSVGKIACFTCVHDTTPRSVLPDAEPVKREFGTGSGKKFTVPTDAQVEAWLLALGRKVTIDDLTEELVAAASRWTRTYTGTFGFMIDMKAAAATRRLRAAQAKGVLNCWRADVLRNGNRTTTCNTHNAERPTTQPAPRPEPEVKAAGFSLVGLPDGRYADPAGMSRMKFQITQGRKQGFVFVDNAGEYGPRSGAKLGRQTPDGVYTGEGAVILARIAADPAAAMAAYGRLTGSCGACNRHLEDAESVARGIGPVCARKFSF